MAKGKKAKTPAAESITVAQPTAAPAIADFQLQPSGEPKSIAVSTESTTGQAAAAEGTATGVGWDPGGPGEAGSLMVTAKGKGTKANKAKRRTTARPKPNAASPGATIQTEMAPRGLVASQATPAPGDEGGFVLGGPGDPDSI